MQQIIVLNALILIIYLNWEQKIWNAVNVYRQDNGLIQQILYANNVLKIVKNAVDGIHALLVLQS